MVGYAQAFFADASGGILHRLQGANAVFSRPDAVDASVSATHFWLASRDAYDDAERRSAPLRLKYFVSLLEPAASAEIAVGGERQYLPDFGYCSAGPDLGRDAVGIDCFLRGQRPALVTARWSGDTAPRETSTSPDYTPAALEMLSSSPYRLTMPRPRGNTASRVTLTAYEARDHVEIAVDAPGMLGGSSCAPSPTSPGTTYGEQP
jgi:hypothetical protein